MKLKDKNLYYIGGIVRDEILGEKSFDIDLTYVGNAIEYSKTIPNVEILKINEPFGTVKITLDGETIDIASTRSEIYPHKGHLPVIQSVGCSLKEDVLRRDFTINALAKSTLTGEIIDYTGGLEDIKSKKLRVLHDKSFIDDPTRIVRGLKFSVRFGFKIETHTKQLQNKYLKNINYDMSLKRLKKELEETFNLNSQIAFDRFISENIYKLLTTKNYKNPNINFENLIKKFKPKNIWIIYAGLIPDIKNLPLTKTEKIIVEDFESLKEKRFESDFEIYKNFNEVKPESVIMFASINYDAVIKYLNKLKYIKLFITGSDIQKLGIKPSIKYQQCFNYLLKQKFLNPKLTKHDEFELVKKFFNIK